MKNRSHINKNKIVQRGDVSAFIIDTSSKKKPARNIRSSQRVSYVLFFYLLFEKGREGGCQPT